MFFHFTKYGGGVDIIIVHGVIFNSLKSKPASYLYEDEFGGMVKDVGE